MKRICLVKGQHTNREYAKECPVLQAKRRAERRQEGRVTGSETGAAIPLQGTPLEQPPARTQRRPRSRPKSVTRRRSST